MRIKITMQAIGRNVALPLDNHPFAALIYNLIGAADYGTAVYLHEEGVQSSPEDGKRFKPFVFSRLQQMGKRVRAGRQWLADGPVEWQISSPIDELMLMLIAALQANPTVFIGDRQGGAQLRVEAVRIIPPPQFTSPMCFKTISPIFAAITESGTGGRPVKHHLRPEDSRFAQSIANNLREKFFVLTGEDAREDELEFSIARALKYQLVQYAGTDHKCCEGVIEVAGSSKLIHLGWEWGFGEANSKGFGMVWAVR